MEFIGSRVGFKVQWFGSRFGTRFSMNTEPNLMNR
jgi:hypothetical protein